MAIYRVTIFGHMQTGEEWNTTWHVQAVTGLAATISATAADAVTEAWTGTTAPAGKLEDYYTAALGVDGVRVDELDSSGHNVSQVVTPLTLVGLSTDELLPPNNAIAASLRTDVPTKSGRGRNFLPSPVVTTVLNQLLATAVQTAIKNAWLRALNWMLDHAAPVGIYHPESVTWDQVVSIDVGDVFDTQNRRRNQQTETRVRSNLS